MKKIILVCGLFLPHFLQAQSIDDAVYDQASEAGYGYYWLTAAPTVRQAGELKLRSNSALVVKSSENPKKVLSPEEVLFFRIGQRHYSTEMIEVTENIFSKVIKRQFVEQLDSGQVMFTHYKRYVYSGGGGAIGGGGTVDEYRLRGPNQATASILHWNMLGICKELPERMLPLASARPDLVKILNEYKLSLDDLRELIYALNTNHPFPYIPKRAIRESKPVKERPVESPF